MGTGMAQDEESHASASTTRADSAEQVKANSQTTGMAQDEEKHASASTTRSDSAEEPKADANTVALAKDMEKNADSAVGASSLRLRAEKAMSDAVNNPGPSSQTSTVG